MKTLFIIPLFLMSLVSFPSWGLTFDDLVQRDGLYYEKFSDVPFTGEIDEGLIRPSFKNGKEEGTWVDYHKNGQVRFKVDYKNGKRKGTLLGYHENGQLHYKVDFKNGKTEGTWVSYHKNGQLSSRGDFKNAQQEGRWEYFNKDRTVFEGKTGIYKNGVKVGD